MAELFFLSEGFPLSLDLNCLIAPLLANYLGDLWIGETGVLRDDFGLLMLAVEDESFVMSVIVTISIGQCLHAYRCEVLGFSDRVGRYKRVQLNHRCRPWYAQELFRGCRSLCLLPQQCRHLVSLLGGMVEILLVSKESWNLLSDWAHS
jgi:hypothetical protein